MSSNIVDARSNNTNRLSIPCRYFLINGSCRNGARCRYAHDRNGDRSTMNLCKYYLYGNCMYGDSCKYEHVRPVNASQRSAGSPPEAAAAASSSSTAGAASSSPKAVAGLPELLKKTKLRADAQEFIPTWMQDESSTDQYDEQSIPADAKDIICPYHILGQCWYGEHCSFLHASICDLCDRPVLHPNDEQQNRKHREECLAEHERDMKAAFAVARTKEKQCGICMEVVLEKANLSARRFGILPSCKHCFCLDCIRKWRQAKTFETKVIRACPECRTVSDFVAPSTVWVEDEDEKKALIEEYQSAMKEKTCKYFREGSREECPFGNKCFYRHVKPDGTVARGDSPRTIRRRQRQRQRREGGGAAANGAGAGGAQADLYLLWEFLDDNDWRPANRLSPDDWPWEFQLDDDLDWLSLSDSESDYYDY